MTISGRHVREVVVRHVEPTPVEGFACRVGRQPLNTMAWARPLRPGAHELNARWDCDAIEKLFHQYSYLQKWQAQLNDRAVRLGL